MNMIYLDNDTLMILTSYNCTVYIKGRKCWVHSQVPYEWGVRSLEKILNDRYRATKPQQRRLQLGGGK